MPTENRKGTKAELEIALAQGVTASAWARANNVSRTTACRWAKTPEVRSTVESIRRRLRDRAVGGLTGRASWALKGVMELASYADSENVRLKALQDIFASLMGAAENSELKDRVARLEERFSELVGVTKIMDGKSADPEQRL
jgi:hypothetical protein